MNKKTAYTIGGNGAFYPQTSDLLPLDKRPDGPLPAQTFQRMYGNSNETALAKNVFQSFDLKFAAGAFLGRMITMRYLNNTDNLSVIKQRKIISNYLAQKIVYY